MPDSGNLLLEALYPGRRPTPTAVQRAHDLAKLSREQTELDEVLRLLSDAVLLCPPDISLHLARAEAHLQRGQLVEALDDAELCVSLDTSCVTGWLLKGRAEWLLGRATDASMSFQAGLRAEPSHPELASRLAEVRAKPPVSLLRQFRDLLFAARLVRTVEDPEKSTDAFVEQHSELLDVPIGLLQQMLRVNTVVLLESSIVCDAYEQVVQTCAHLVAGAPAAFSHRLRNAGDVVEGLSLALRVGWQVRHSVPKFAANALVALGTCPDAEDGLRRRAVRHLLGGMLRWLLDAGPEPEKESEEVCGCSCSAPWKAAACFLERLLEVGKPQPWVKEECERWPDAAQFCQWLTLSIRDYHATPLGLVLLLQFPGVAAAAMQSEAMVDFFIPALLPDDDFDGRFDDAGFHEDELQLVTRPGGGTNSGNGANTSSFASSFASIFSAAASASSRVGEGAAASGGGGLGGASGSSLVGADFGGHDPDGSGDAAEARPRRGFEDTDWPLPTQRLGEWLMASIGYLLLFVEGDVLFTVAACKALQAMAAADPAGQGATRLLEGLWLGVPLLNKLSLYACNHTCALDLLHCLFRSGHRGVRVAARSLAHALARPPPPPPRSLPAFAELFSEEANAEVDSHSTTSIDRSPASNFAASHVGAATSGVVEGGASADAETQPQPRSPDEEQLQFFTDDEAVPSWADFYQELCNELDCTPDKQGEPPDLVTLANFEEKAALLAELVVIRATPAGMDITAVPAAWNRLGGHGGGTHHGSNLGASRWPAGLTPRARVDDNPVPLPDAALALATHKVDFPLRLPLCSAAKGDPEVGSEAFAANPSKRGCVVIISRQSIRQSSKVLNWAQAVAAAARAGAAAVIVVNDLDTLEPFRMGLFGEPPPGIPAFMVGGSDGAALRAAAELGCEALIAPWSVYESEMFFALNETPSAGTTRVMADLPPPWPLSGGRLPVDIAQAWSLLEALPDHDGAEQAELKALLARMNSPEKRVWLTRRLVRHHRSRQSTDDMIEEPPLAFVEGDRSLSSSGQLAHARWQLCENTGLGAEDLCGEFEVRFKDEQGVGSALMREWMDLVSHEVFLHPGHRLLRSYDMRRTFWPDPAAPFVNPQWQMDYEALGRLMGLALWHSCTLDLPLHPHVCALVFGFPREAIQTTLADIDEELDRLKAQWLLAHPVEELGCAMPYSDALPRDEPPAAPSVSLNETEPREGGAEFRNASTTMASDMVQHRGAPTGRQGQEHVRRQIQLGGSGDSPLDGARVVAQSAKGAETGSDDAQGEAAMRAPAAEGWLREVVRPRDRLAGDHRAWPGAPLCRVGAVEVALHDEGSEEVVTDENKTEFVATLTQWRLFDSITPQIDAMARGLATVVPEQALAELRGLISPEEMVGLLSGSGEIDMDDWEQHTAYSHGLSERSNLVKWFWRTVRSWASSTSDSSRLAQLLQFVTGSARVPVGGFAELVGFNGAKHLFTLSLGSHLTPQSLPMAHACICTLDIPPYADEATCSAKLTQMLLFGRAPFDEAAGHAHAEDDD